MIRVVIESPYAGAVEENVAYALACLADCLARGEAPFASHLLYTQALNDRIMAERRLGIEAGFAWGDCADLHAFYTDRGWSAGMRAAYARAVERGYRIEIRSLGAP